jgi:spore germination protein GerM
VIWITIPLAASCGIPTESSPQAINPSNVPFHLLDPTVPTTTTTQPLAVGVPEEIYLANPTQQLVAVAREVPPPATLTEILGALMDGPTNAESSMGLQSFLSGSASDVTVSFAGGIATVDFLTNPIQEVGPDQILAVAQVVYTATQQPTVTGVVFQISGQPIEVPDSSDVLVPGPVNRATYAPQAPTSPTTTVPS